MHGLTPESIGHLSHLRGAEIIQVCVGQNDLQFRFQPSENISVQGRSELFDAGGVTIDVWENGRRSEAFRFLDLLGQPVTDVTIDTPKSFKLTFENGLSLRVVDNSDCYESFSVGNLYV